MHSWPSRWSAPTARPSGRWRFATGGRGSGRTRTSARPATSPPWPPPRRAGGRRAAVRESEERFRSLVKAAAAIVWTVPASGAIAGRAARLDGLHRPDARGVRRRAAGSTPSTPTTATPRPAPGRTRSRPAPRTGASTGSAAATASTATWWPAACRSSDDGGEVRRVGRRPHRRHRAAAAPTRPPDGPRSGSGCSCRTRPTSSPCSTPRGRSFTRARRSSGSSASSTEDRVGHNIFRDTITHPDDRGAKRAFFEAALGRPGETVTGRFRLRHTDGTYRDIEAVAVNRLDDPAVAGVVANYRDITERQQFEEALRLALDEAEAAGRAKDQFLAVLSHELRNPLNPVLVGVSAMLADPTTPASVRPTLEVVRRNVALEARLIDDLLDVTQIRQGKLRLDRQAVDAHALVREALEICRDEIAASGLRLTLDLSAPRPPRRGRPRAAPAGALEPDQERRQVHPARGLDRGPARAPAARAAATWSSRSPTSGVGIAAEALPRIFNAFEQADASVAKQFGGLGPGPGDQPEPGRGARRPPHGRERRARPGVDVHARPCPRPTPRPGPRPTPPAGPPADGPLAAAPHPAGGRQPRLAPGPRPAPRRQGPPGDARRQRRLGAGRRRRRRPLRHGHQRPRPARRQRPRRDAPRPLPRARPAGSP